MFLTHYGDCKSRASMLSLAHLPFYDPTLRMLVFSSYLCELHLEGDVGIREKKKVLLTDSLSRDARSFPNIPADLDYVAKARALCHTHSS